MTSNAAYWQYGKILILGWEIMYPEQKYVFETKPVLAGAERLRDLSFRKLFAQERSPLLAAARDTEFAGANHSAGGSAGYFESG
jgi:hypothetical protein